MHYKLDSALFRHTHLEIEATCCASQPKFFRQHQPLFLRPPLSLHSFPSFPLHSCQSSLSVSISVSVCACVHACVRACVRAYVSVHQCMRSSICLSVPTLFSISHCSFPFMQSSTFAVRVLHTAYIHTMALKDQDSPPAMQLHIAYFHCESQKSFSLTCLPFFRLSSSRSLFHSASARHYEALCD